MSKSVLIISASPRKGGNSDTLCDQFAKGAKEAGNDLKEEPREDAVWEYSERMTLSAAANNENNVQVYAEYTDNA